MSQRPESVTVIAWLLILLGAFGLMGCVAAWTMQDMPMMHALVTAYRVPYSVVIGLACSSFVVNIGCAVGFLMRQGWARHVYVVTALAMLVFGAWASPWPQFELPSLLFPTVASMFLYRPLANRWFDAQETAAG